MKKKWWQYIGWPGWLLLVIGFLVFVRGLMLAATGLIIMAVIVTVIYFYVREKDKV